MRDFIQKNYISYHGNGSFLARPLERRGCGGKRQELTMEEHKNGGVYDVDTKTVTTTKAYQPRYIDERYEIIVSL